MSRTKCSAGSRPGKVSSIASKVYGHRFRKMLDELTAFGTREIATILASDFDVTVAMTLWRRCATDIWKPGIR